MRYFINHLLLRFFAISLLLPVSVSLLGGCSKDTRSTNEQGELEWVEIESFAIGEPFTRIAEHAGQNAFQVAVKTYQPAAAGMPEVRLLSMIHVGERAFYTEAQTISVESDLTLYEGVGAPTDPNFLFAFKFDSSCQKFASFMDHGNTAFELGLEEQNSLMSTKGSSFVRADLDLDTLFKRFERVNFVQKTARNLGLEDTSVCHRVFAASLQSMEDKGELKGITVEDLLAMDENDYKNLVTKQSKRRLTREDVAKSVVTNSTGHAHEFDAAFMRVIRDERDEIAVDALKDRLHAGHKTITIQYGAGHMPGIEKLIVKMGYKADFTTWLTVFHY